jgi:hypothetical protein
MLWDFANLLITHGYTEASMGQTVTKVTEVISKLVNAGQN